MFNFLRRLFHRPKLIESPKPAPYHMGVDQAVSGGDRTVEITLNENLTVVDHRVSDDKTRSDHE